MLKRKEVYSYYKKSIDYCTSLVDPSMEAKERERIVDDLLFMYKHTKFTGVEYFILDLYKKPHEEWINYLPDLASRTIYERFDGKSHFNSRDKYEVYLRYKDFFFREACKVSSVEDKDVFLSFVNKYEKVMIKPLGGSLGDGIKIIKIADCQEENYFENLLPKYPEGFIAEEIIVQDERMAKLNPTSVNTLRVTTIRMDNRVEAQAFLRVGKLFAKVDNVAKGGIVCCLEPETGKITRCKDKFGRDYTSHPDTQMNLIGYQIPRFDEAIEFCKKLAYVCPEFRYMGWDIALTPNGWVMVELNAKAGIYCIQQSLGRGIRKEMQGYLRELGLPTDFPNMFSEEFEKQFYGTQKPIKRGEGLKCFKQFNKSHNSYLRAKGQYLFGSTSALEVLRELNEKHIEENPPKITIVDGGYILPRKRFRTEKSVKDLGGVLNENLEYLPESKEYDFGGKYEFELGSARYLDEEVIFLGRHYPHFGVVLIDTVRRLYFRFLEQGKNLKVAVCGVYSEEGTFGKANARSWEYFEDLGIKKEDLIDVRVPTKFKRIYVPEAGFEYMKNIHKEFRLPFEYLKSKVKPKPFEKIYLSRKMMATSKEAGEQIFEKFFKMNGFEIIYPDELSILEQVSYYKGAKIIASVEGTASHNILFCEPGTKQICIRKNTRIEPRHFLFNEIMNSECIYIDCYCNFIPKFPRHYDIGPFCMTFNKNMVDFAKENGYKLPKFIKLNNFKTALKYIKMCNNQIDIENKIY